MSPAGQVAVEQRLCLCPFCTPNLPFFETVLEVFLDRSTLAIPMWVCCRALGPALNSVGLGVLPRDQQLNSLPTSASSCLAHAACSNGDHQESCMSGTVGTREFPGSWELRGLLGVSGQNPSHLPS